MYSFTFAFSAYLTILLTLERYVVICKPNWVKGDMIKKTNIAIWSVTAFSILYNISRFFENRWENGRLTRLLMANTIYKIVYKTWIYFVFAFILPSVILIIFNILIIKKVLGKDIVQ